MSNREVRNYLSLPHIAKLATINLDGSPQMSPVWFYFEANHIFIATYKESTKVRNIRRNPLVSVLVDSSGGGLKLKGVLMQGKAELVEARECKRFEKMIYDKYLPPTITRRDKVAAAFKQSVTGQSNSSMCIKVIPEKICSWNYVKMKLKDVTNSEFQAYAINDPTKIFHQS